MSGQQTARDDARPGLDEWQPGTAKRAPNFDEVLANGRDYRWRAGHSVVRLQEALLFGALDLSPLEFKLLAFYVAAINEKRLEEQGRAFVWISNGFLLQRLKCTDRTLRKAKARLEALGYIVRCYDRANHAAGQEAIDLRPALARLEEFEAADDGLRIQRDQERADQLAHSAATAAITRPDEVKDVRGGGTTGPPEQTNGNFSSSVESRATSARPGSAEASPSEADRSQGDPPPAPPNRREGRYVSATSSPRRASGPSGVHPKPSVAAEMLREELLLAREACPRLRRVITEDLVRNPASAGVAERSWALHLARELLPEAARNNDHTMSWLWARHGVRALVMFAVALEASWVTGAGAWLGSMANPNVKIWDMRPSLRRIIREAAGGGEAEEPPAEPGQDPRWARILAALQHELAGNRGQAALKAWFGGVEVLGIEGGMLILACPSTKAAEQIRGQHASAVVRAAVAAGHQVDRLMVSVKKK